ncbi:MAG: hypothetical protein WA843_04885 [Candidatus Saccharimonadales bacterium]
MEPQAPQPPEPPKAPAPAPVMDVVPPPIEKPADQANSSPVPDTPVKQKDAKHAAKAAKKAAAKQPTLPKQPGHGVGLAIFATVIIILGLAALATYAYLKTNHSI